MAKVKPIHSYEVEFKEGKSLFNVYYTKSNFYFCRYGRWNRKSLGPCFDVKELIHRFLKSQQKSMVPVFEKDLQFWINATEESDGVLTLKVFRFGDDYVGLINVYGKIIESTSAKDSMREIIFDLYARLRYLYFKIEEYD